MEQPVKKVCNWNNFKTAPFPDAKKIFKLLLLFSKPAFLISGTVHPAFMQGFGLNDSGNPIEPSDSRIPFSPPKPYHQ